MTGQPAIARFETLAARWGESAGLAIAPGSNGSRWAARFFESHDDEPCRPPADPAALRSWERRYGFPLPAALRSWLALSDGLYRRGPLIHPLTAIGPMIPFARIPDLIVQPECWFELGNPGVETVCIDLGYRWPGGDFPVFASGDDLRGTSPRIIATGFSAWLGRLLREGGREYWLDPGFATLGDPWAAHRQFTPTPSLPDRLRPLAPSVCPLMEEGADDRAIASRFGITRGDVEAIFRHLQHRRAGVVGA